MTADDANQSDTETPTPAQSNVAASARAALAAVFAVLATTPLYALRFAFGPEGVPANPDNVVGLLSLMLWSWLTVVGLKYLVLVVRADDRGEGGIMALFVLARRTLADAGPGVRTAIAALGLTGVALVFAIAVIAPAMTALSAAEGLLLIEGARPRQVLWLAALATLAPFVVRRLFKAPGAAWLIALWLLVIAVLGAIAIATRPQVLWAINPWQGLAFLWRNGVHGLAAPASLVLALAGAELIYARLGEYSAMALRRTWWIAVFPAIALCVFGQGAALLSNATPGVGPFFLLVPEALRWAMIVLALLVGGVAARSLADTVFPIAREAVQLGYLPRLRMERSSHDDPRFHSFQLPQLSRLIVWLSLFTVLLARSAHKLAAAHAVALAAGMVVTTLLALCATHALWRWSRVTFVLAMGALLVLEVALLLAAIVGLPGARLLPLVLAAAAGLLMAVWRHGRERLQHKIASDTLELESFCESIAAHPPPRVEGTAVVLTSRPEFVPPALLQNLKHNRVLHQDILVLSVQTVDAPLAHDDERLTIEHLGQGFHRGILRFGFAEDTKVPAALRRLAPEGIPLDPRKTTYILSREAIVATARTGALRWRDQLFVFMARNATPAYDYFGIPSGQLVEIGTQREI